MAITRLGPNNSTNISGINLTSQVTGTLPTGNGGTGATSFSPGKVLQVVHAHTGTEATSNSTTYADTGLTATITPSSTSSKVLVFIDQSVSKAGSTYGNIRVYRGSTEIGGAVAGRSIGYTGDSTHNYVGMGFTNSFLDTPSSTSALVYKTQFNNNNADGTIRVQVDSGQSYMCLMEIAS